MDELVTLVSQKTGLAEEMSRSAVETVITFLKNKLPDPIADQLDKVLSGTDASDQLEGLTKGLLGGFFSQK